ncbi:MAG: hypothetical protein IV090_24650 [Candidatus Sericytochromatia bacterium]|nr:hypothetical protein [Candidatus Sericytochromatia bacterium]
MRNIVICAAISVFSALPANAKIIDIKAIAGKTPTQVEKILGKADSKENVKPSGTGCNPCPKMLYKSGFLSISLFGYDGKSDYIYFKTKAK